MFVQLMAKFMSYMTGSQFDDQCVKMMIRKIKCTSHKL